MTWPTLARISSLCLWHAVFSTWWQIRGWSDWLAWPRQCQEPVRPWPRFQNTGKSFLTLISYDGFTRSRPFTKEEVQKKCFLGKLFYFKVFKDIIKTRLAFQWKGSKPENLYVRLVLGLLNKKSNLAVNALSHKWDWNRLGEAVNEEIRTLISYFRQKLEVQRYRGLVSWHEWLWVREHKDIHSSTLALPSGCALCDNSDVISVMVAVVWGAGLLCCYPWCVCATGSARGSLYPSG